MKSMTNVKRIAILAALLTVSGVPACGKDDSSGGGGPDGGDTGPAYLVGTRVWNDTVTTSYVHVVPSLDEATTIDPSKALEIGGSATLYSIPGLGWFAVGNAEDVTFTRYTLSSDRKLVKQEKISLQPQGVQKLWDTLYVISPTKIYYPDPEGQQIIVINPTAMTVERTIKLPQTARNGYLSVYGYGSTMRDGKILFTVGWFDWQQGDKVLGETGLVVLDTATDTVSRVDVDNRCGGITTPVVMDSGDTYFTSSALAASAHKLGRLSTAPCALRIKAGADAFDPSYVANLSDVTSAPIVGEPIPAGGNSMFLRVFDESAGTVRADDQTWKLTGQPVWQWWRWDVTTAKAVRINELPSGTADVLWFKVGDQVFGTESKSDNSSTTLIDLTAAGGPKRSLTAPGFLYGLARVQ
ncbi:hypothetical protein LVJ94_05845 [Pendulispora rubella]|uniref:Uncharacterized protein n=1 Tax=Pendulispora rubella TaxID=2741070 RepID=A0ABZ2L7M0_9BACT